ncbi:MAG: hypothetical protein ACFB4I_03050 [Cyanophyceae cyanobacterium]
MSVSPSNSFQAQLLQLLEQLPPLQHQKVLDFALQLQKKDPIQQWDEISDEEAAALKAEFEEEDLAIAEANLTDYVAMLQQKDRS